jgi:hypothetical protein
MKKFARAGSTFGTLVAAAVVLAVATTGGAVAGGLITSKQIKNNTIKSKDVRDGALKGVDITNGSLSGADLAPGVLSSAATLTLSSGMTVRGTIGERQNNLLAGQEIGATASLPVPAPVALDDAHVAVDGVDDPTGACAGSSTNPTAAPGYVCIYPWYTLNTEPGPLGYIWGSVALANAKYGFQLSFRALANGSTALFANWA